MSRSRRTAHSIGHSKPRVGAPLQRGLFYSLAIFGGFALMGALLALKGGASSYNVSIMYFAGEDVWVFALGFGLLLLLRLRPDLFPPLPAQALSATRRNVGLLAAIVFIAGYAGSALIMERYPLSIDEFWVLFDASAMSEGYLLAPVAPEWRGFADALQPVFRRAIADGAFLGSTYLPVNAALHASFAQIGDAWLTGPVLAAMAVVLLYAVTREIWPERRDAAFVAVLLLATSAQFLFTAMTPYAMTAHLAFNLAWLWLFLRNTPGSHAGALVTGLAATGLHQLVFHPLFAAPFVAKLWLNRRWRLAAAYTVGYAAISAFWILYGALLHPGTGVEADAQILSFAERVGAMLASEESTAQMLNNLARLVAWQNPLIVILIAAALMRIRHWPQPLPELAAGIVIMLGLVVIVMPFQGYGWGYRYLHGFLGSLSLIAAFGWIALAERDAAFGRAALAACTAFALVMLPLRAWQAHAFAHPYAELFRAVRGSGADIVILDPTDIWFGAHQVRNGPFLKAPKMLLLNRLNAEEVRRLCSDNSVAVLDYDAVKPFGVRIAEPRIPTLHSPHVTELRNMMSETGCGKPLKGPGT